MEGLTMNDNTKHTGGRSNRGETARDLVAQSMYSLMRLTRLGFQAAASGIGRLEESMARRQRERTEARPTGEAPPATTPEAPPPRTGEAGEATSDRPGTQDSGESRH